MADYSQGDMSQFKDKETFLSGLRSSRIANEPRTPIASQTLRGTVPTDEGEYRRDEGTGSGTAQPVHGANGSSQGAEGSSNGVSEQLRSIFGESTGSSSSTYHPEPARTKSNPIGNITKRYRDALKTPPKPKAEGEKKAPSGRGSSKLSDAEVIKLRPKLVEFILWQSEHMDQFIIATTRGHDPSIEIWSNLTHDEAEILADYLIFRGRNDAKAAAFVRTTATLIDRLRIGLIILPRAYQTIATYGDKGISLR